MPDKEITLKTALEKLDKEGVVYAKIITDIGSDVDAAIAGSFTLHFEALYCYLTELNRAFGSIEAKLQEQIRIALEESPNESNID